MTCGDRCVCVSSAVLLWKWGGVEMDVANPVACCLLSVAAKDWEALNFLVWAWSAVF